MRLNRTGVRGGSLEFAKGGERFTAINMPFGALVLTAYNITVRQLSGPGEFLSERYDVAAKAEHPVKPPEMLRMLQNLLQERFRLVLRRESKEVPVYELTVARGGLKLKETRLPESAVPRTPVLAGGAEPQSGHLIFTNESMPDLAWALSRMAGIGDRIVVDRTGLKGRYDFELQFERDRPPAAGPDEHAPAPRDGPSLFTALQEQLGLKLQPAKAPVEFLTIEHVERPDGN